VWISVEWVGVPATVGKRSDRHQIRLSGPLNGKVTPPKYPYSERIAITIIGP